MRLRILGQVRQAYWLTKPPQEGEIWAWFLGVVSTSLESVYRKSFLGTGNSQWKDPARHFGGTAGLEWGRGITVGDADSEANGASSCGSPYAPGWRLQFLPCVRRGPKAEFGTKERHLTLGLKDQPSSCIPSRLSVHTRVEQGDKSGSWFLSRWEMMVLWAFWLHVLRPVLPRWQRRVSHPHSLPPESKGLLPFTSP